MAKNKIADYLDYPLDIVFDDMSGLSIKDIHKETGIPVWQLKELEELGYIREDKVIQEGKLILKVLMYCMNDRRFLKSAVGKISYRDRTAMYESIKTGHTKLMKWIYTRVYNLKVSGQKVNVKNIYTEACEYFPDIKEQSYKGYNNIKKYVMNAKRAYYRKIKK